MLQMGDMQRMDRLSEIKKGKTIIISFTKHKFHGVYLNRSFKRKSNHTLEESEIVFET